MRLRHVLSAAVAATGLVGSVAQASLSITLVPVVVRYDDPARTNGSDLYPTNARTYNVLVTQTGSEKWTAGEVNFTLAQVSASGVSLSGNFFQSAIHENYYQPNLVSSDPTLQYDTYATSPDFDNTGDMTEATGHLDILGTSDIGHASVAGPGSISGPTVDLAWGDKNSAVNVAGPGTWRIGSLTVVGNTGGYISGYATSTTDAATFTKQPFSNVYLPIAGDTNSDGAVDGTDFNLWFANLGNHDNPAMTSDKTYYPGDFNQDGQVDGADFNLWFASLGNHLSPSGAESLALSVTPAELAALTPSERADIMSVVPEPGSLALLSVGVMTLLGRKRKLKVS